jgi:hypothetical protein
MTIILADPSDQALARSIFGTHDPTEIESLILDWSARQGFRQGSVASLELSVGAGVTLALPDGSKRFIKVWGDRADPRALAAQAELQRRMAAGGYPSPAVLSSVTPLGPGWAVAMQYDRSGVATDTRLEGVARLMAFGLAQLIREASAFSDLTNLPTRVLPREGAIWPTPHNVLFDFEKTRAGAEWIDDIARNALDTMRRAGSSLVVGHHDWSAKNMRMQPDAIAVVYDWDATFLDRETFFLGTAAAHFPVTWELPVPETPTLREMIAFVRDHEQARSLAFTRAELAEVEAAATYARAYKARCEHAGDAQGARWCGSSRESLKANGPLTGVFSS